MEGEKRAGLGVRLATAEQRLPFITEQVNVLWKTSAGVERPAHSGMQLMTTAEPLAVEEHLATAETHLRYAEKHLLPKEEYLADAEVHLKLVRAHLAVIELPTLLEEQPTNT
jgi:hypothetical protein